MSLMRLLALGAIICLVAPPAHAQPTASAAGRLERSARPITPDNPIPRRLQSDGAIYPAEAGAAGATGTVTLQITVDANGTVAEARPVAISARGSDPEFSVNFLWTSEDERRKLLALQLNETDVRRASGAIESMIKAALDAARLWIFSPPANAPISMPVAFRLAANETEAPAATASAPQRSEAVYLDGKITPPTRLHNVPPVYPPLAQAARVQGVVIVEARIERDGTVSHAAVTRSIPLLDQAALEAVVQWRFTPTLVDGKPVPVMMTVTTNFKLR